MFVRTTWQMYEHFYLKSKQRMKFIFRLNKNITQKCEYLSVKLIQSIEF
jgi:hypothetical protein